MDFYMEINLNNLPGARMLLKNHRYNNIRAGKAGTRAHDCVRAQTSFPEVQPGTKPTVNYLAITGSKNARLNLLLLGGKPSF